MFTSNGLINAIAAAAGQGFQPGGEFILILHTLDGMVFSGLQKIDQLTEEAVSFTHEERFQVVPAAAIARITFDRVAEANGTDILAEVEATPDAQAQGETVDEAIAAPVAEAADEPAVADAADDDEAATETPPVEDDEPDEVDVDVDVDATEPEPLLVPEGDPSEEEDDLVEIGEPAGTPELVPA
jgi:hypothetical protein